MTLGIRFTRGVKGVLREIDRILRSELLLKIFVFLLMSNGALASQFDDRLLQRHRNCPISKEIITSCSCWTGPNDIDINIQCDGIDDKQFENTLDVLKKNPNKTSYIRTHDSSLKNIQNNSFQGIELKSLSLIKSGIIHVEPYALSGLASTLFYLDLRYNDIKVVPTTALSTLKSLTTLLLSNNKIDVLNNSSFAGMTSLENLQLSKNKIYWIHADAFKGMGNILTYLGLKRNHVNEIPLKTFHTLVNLRKLNLGYNNIEHLPDGAFEGLKSLDRLWLQHNQITSIQQNVFKDLNMLTSLDIGHNRIISVDEGAFTGLERNLRSLDLEGNSLVHIPAHALRNLVGLETLNLRNNTIRVIEEHDFEGYGSTLIHILLDNNLIKVIHEKAFEDLYSIWHLSLSNNLITTVTKNTIQSILDTMDIVDISNNPLECGCDVNWINECLKHNYLTSLKITLEHKCLTNDGEIHTIYKQKDFECPNITDPPNSTSNPVEAASIAQANSHPTILKALLYTVTLTLIGYFV